MTPILCVGETLQERELGATEDRVTGQVRAALAGVGEGDAANLVVAYEPIWAIGTGRNAEPSDAGQVIGLIRSTIAELYDGAVADAVRDPVRREREGGEHPRLHGASRDRRRARRRREPGSRGVRAHREVPVMRRLLYVCLDGLGDDPVPELDGRTPLEAAATPFLDSLALRGRTGTVVTVGEGIAPESDIAVFAILGYDPQQEHPGRGVVEAIGVGMDFRDGDLAHRVNFATGDGSAHRRPAGRAGSLVGAGAGPRRRGERTTGAAGRDLRAAGDGRAPGRAASSGRTRGRCRRRSRTPIPRTGSRARSGSPWRRSSPRSRRSEPLEDSEAARRAASLTNAFVEGSARILDASEVNARAPQGGPAPRQPHPDPRRG